MAVRDAPCRSTPRCSTAAPSAGASSTRCRTTRARTWPSTSSGLSASMLTVDCATCAGHMRCAKRSSAALRTAVALEASAEQLELEQLEPVASPLLPQDLRPATDRRDHVHAAKAQAHASGVGVGVGVGAARLVVRGGQVPRDLKSCFEQSQRATSCGDVPLVRVPLLGRAIRVFGSWYALCSMCGALARVTPALALPRRDLLPALRLCDARGQGGGRARCARRCPNRLRLVPLLRQGGARERRGDEVAAASRRRLTPAGATRACRLRCAPFGTARRTTGRGWLPRTRPCRPRRSSRTW